MPFANWDVQDPRQDGSTSRISSTRESLALKKARESITVLWLSEVVSGAFIQETGVHVL